MEIYDSILIIGLRCWKQDEHNYENDPCCQEEPNNRTVHVNISLLHNSNKEQACS